MDFNENTRAPNALTSSFSAPHKFLPGQVVGGRYEVLSILGAGGMGIVYRVKQIYLNKEFALKTLDTRNLSGGALRRFQQEARVTFSIEHPNIVRVLDFGLFEDDTPFLAMEVVQGETLSDRLKRAGSLSTDDALALFVQISLGLSYAHDCGVVHRDIKPSNIMIINDVKLGEEGSVKILDFGIAKLTAHEDGEIQALTKTGEIFGSPLYMSPEQCSGLKVDNRADVYSLGCMLFESLTGAPPFFGDNALATMLKHQGKVAPSLKDASLGGKFPKALEQIVAKMLAKSPEQRYSNIGLVAHDLGALRRGQFNSDSVISDPHRSSSKNTITLTKQNFYSLLAGIIISAGALGGIAGFQFFDHTNHAPPANEIVYKPHDLVQPAMSRPIGGKDELDYQELPISQLKLYLASPRKDGTLELSNKKVPGEALKIIGQTSWVHVIGFRYCDISNKDFNFLSALHLDRVDVADSNFNDVGAHQLAHFKHINSLNADRSEITDMGAAQFAMIKDLESLTIAGNNLIGTCLSFISTSKSIRVLNVMDDKQIPDAKFVSLQNMHLHSFDAADSAIGERGLAALAKIDGLVDVTLNGTNITCEDLIPLCKNRSVKTVDIARCPNITKTDVVFLRQRFPSINFIDASQKKLT